MPPPVIVQSIQSPTPATNEAVIPIPSVQLSRPFTSAATDGSTGGMPLTNGTSLQIYAGFAVLRYFDGLAPSHQPSANDLDFIRNNSYSTFDWISEPIHPPGSSLFVANLTSLIRTTENLPSSLLVNHGSSAALLSCIRSLTFEPTAAPVDYFPPVNPAPPPLIATAPTPTATSFAPFVPPITNAPQAADVAISLAPDLTAEDPIQSHYLESRFAEHRERHYALKRAGETHGGIMYSSALQARLYTDIVKENLKLTFEKAKKQHVRYDGHAFVDEKHRQTFAIPAQHQVGYDVQTFTVGYHDVLAWLGWRASDHDAKRGLLKAIQDLNTILAQHNFPSRYSDLTAMLPLILEADLDNPLPATAIVHASSNYSAAHKAVINQHVSSFSKQCRDTIKALKAQPLPFP